MRRILGAAAGALSVTALAAGLGGTAASAATVVSRTEHFQFVGVSATSSRDSAIAWGVFAAGGTINLNTGRIRFHGGTFRAIHHRTSATTAVNRKSCLLLSVEHGTYRLAGGTGKYTHIAGHGTYTSRVWAVLRRTATGRCSQSKPPRAFQQIINARGPVRGVPPALRHGWARPARIVRRAG
jgi:hypothetical protein